MPSHNVEILGLMETENFFNLKEPFSRITPTEIREITIDWFWGHSDYDWLVDGWLVSALLKVETFLLLINLDEILSNWCISIILYRLCSSAILLKSFSREKSACFIQYLMLCEEDDPATHDQSTIDIVWTIDHCFGASVQGSEKRESKNFFFSFCLLHLQYLIYI